MLRERIARAGSVEPRLGQGVRHRRAAGQARVLRAAAGRPAAGDAARGLRPLLSLLRIERRRACARVLNDWLGTTLFVADDLRRGARRARASCRRAAAFVVKAGHVVTRVGVRFYAADSEQAGMLARQQEIENLDASGARAGAARRRGARRAAVRAEAAHTQARARAAGRALRSAERATQRVHALQIGRAQARAGARALHAAQHADSRGTRRDRRADRGAARDAGGIGGEIRAVTTRELAELQGALRRRPDCAFEALDASADRRARASCANSNARRTDARFAARNAAQPHRGTAAQHRRPRTSRASAVASALEDARAELETIERADRARRPAGRARHPRRRKEAALARRAPSNSTT